MEFTEAVADTLGNGVKALAHGFLFALRGPPMQRGENALVAINDLVASCCFQKNAATTSPVSWLHRERNDCAKLAGPPTRNMMLW